MLRSVLRPTSALVILAYVVCHLGDHITLLVSIPLADQVHHLLIDPWRSAPGTVLLVASILTHYGNALWSIYVRRSLRLAGWGWWQLGLGLAIPVLLSLHLASTRLTEIEIGVAADYQSVLLRQWVLAPWKGVVQAAMLATVWLHASIGVHFWLRTKRWYPRWQPALLVFALLWPVLALAGYVSAGAQVARAASTPAYVADELARAHLGAAILRHADVIALYIVLGHAALVGLAFAARFVRAVAERRRRSILISHPVAGIVPARPGATVLEALVEHGVRHASVCGGRARCTTCRVLVVRGLEHLAPPSALEARALTRIGAPETCRLACQTRPARDLAIVPLLPPGARALDGHGRAGFAGSEHEVTVMFVDIRGSTRLGEARLPYDILFLLDQFFREMAAALDAAGGHFSQFTGDGLMALFGLPGSPASDGAAAALRCAADMLARVETLNRRLLPDLGQPLRIGIGIHHGEAIVGPLGPPGSRIVTAIGDTVNVTARLEGLSKQHDGAVIVSRAAATAAGLDGGGLEPLVAALTGRSEAVEYFALAGLP